MASSKPKGGSKKKGRDTAKCKRYRDSRKREKSKIRRILQSSGLDAATAYAEKWNLVMYLKSLPLLRRRLMERQGGVV